MFGNLLRALSGPAPAIPTPSGQMALAALLVRIARADGDYAAAEVARIDRVLTARYGLTAADAAATRHSAETLEAGASDNVRFTRAIKEAVPYEDRTAVIEALWSVVLADGGRASDEDAMLRLLAGLLGVSDQDSARARQRVEKQA